MMQMNKKMMKKNKCTVCKQRIQDQKSITTFIRRFLEIVILAFWMISTLFAGVIMLLFGGLIQNTGIVFLGLGTFITGTYLSYEYWKLSKKS